MLGRALRSIVYLSCLLALAAASGECQSFEGFALFERSAAFQAQSPTSANPAAPGQVTQAPKLNINVIEGAGAVNNVATRAAREFTVEVDDQNDHPVAGAMVTFFVSAEGPGGSFAGDTQTLTVMTDDKGRAVATSFRPNGTVGDYKIEVTATYSNETATTFISQSNQRPAALPVKQHSGKKIAILVAAGAAVAVGVAVGMSHGGSSSSSSSSTTTTATLGLGSGATVTSPH